MITPLLFLSIILILALLGILALLRIVWELRQNLLNREQNPVAQILKEQIEEKHRFVLQDMNKALNDLSDRLHKANFDTADTLRNSVHHELTATREAMKELQLSQTNKLAEVSQLQTKQLAEVSEAMLKKLHETLSTESKAQQEHIQGTLQKVTQQLRETVDNRLQEISGKVDERLEKGFEKTNETFTKVMERLATIDKAQEKIEGLTGNVVSLQALLGDKKARGAFGEVQLENLVRDIMPPDTYHFQEKLSNGTRVDCLLSLPEPTGKIAIDAKFPLENYQKIYQDNLSEVERKEAIGQFKRDMKTHITAISSKYIIPNETSDGAVMFIPSEAVFAEVHANHADVVSEALKQRVWLVSPTTLMAVLNMARAVIRDVETRKHVNIIKQALDGLGQEFGRFDERMKKLANHIRQAHEDAENVRVTSEKITTRFSKIKHIEIQGEVLHEAPLIDHPLIGDDE